MGRDPKDDGFWEGGNFTRKGTSVFSAQGQGVEPISAKKERNPAKTEKNANQEIKFRLPRD